MSNFTKITLNIQEFYCTFPPVENVCSILFSFEIYEKVKFLPKNRVHFLLRTPKVLADGDILVTGQRGKKQAQDQWTMTAIPLFAWGTDSGLKMQNFKPAKPTTVTSLYKGRSISVRLYGSRVLIIATRSSKKR
jgi:hypothetical protein